MKKLLALLLFPLTVAAAPYLTCDPQCYDATALCPTGYEFSNDNGATWVDLDAVVEGDTIRIYTDMQPYNPGSYNWQVRATNQWGTSDSVPFDFAAGNPAAPGGLRLTAN